VTDDDRPPSEQPTGNDGRVSGDGVSSDDRRVSGDRVSNDDRRVSGDRVRSDEVGGNEERLDGADPETVRAALADGDPLPGTAGFAGLLDGVLVRDVLGRRPVYVDQSAPSRWAFDPTAVSEPALLPAGHRLPLGADPETAERVWSLPAPESADPSAALENVKRAVRERVLSGVASTSEALSDTEPTAEPATPTPPSDGTAESVAVAFSGGVDSAVVAAGLPDAPLYVAGFEGCHDVAAARDAAAAMGRAADLTVVEITHADLRRVVPLVVDATGRSNPMDVSIAVPLFCVAERAAADGYDHLAVGQGADELFGGYAKLVDPDDDDRVAADTVRGARREVVLSLPDQLPRDVATLRAAGVEPVTPLLHDDVVAAALRLPGSLLATETERKIALRRAADGLVPDTVRTADKKAVQYGTYVSRELDRLARRAGFKRRMDDHVGRYVTALAAGDDDPSPEDW
jgi:asparagine synthase (glutamine-hydrolysing)